VEILCLKSDLIDDQAGCYRRKGGFRRQKTPVGVLIYRNLLRALLYLISPRPRNLRGHYDEKCGTGPELFNNARRRWMRSNIVMLRRPKAGGMRFETRRIPAGRYVCILTGTSGIMRNSTSVKFLILSFFTLLPSYGLVESPILCDQLNTFIGSPLTGCRCFCTVDPIYKH